MSQSLLKILIDKAKKKTSWVDRLLYLILATGIVFALFFIFYGIWTAFTSQSVTRLLPAGKTVAYAEWQDLSLPTRAKAGTVLDLMGLTPFIQSSFGLDAVDLHEHLAKGRIGFALLDLGTGSDQLLMFALAPSRSKVLAWMNGLTVPGEELNLVGTSKDPIYAFPQSQKFAFGFAGPFMLVARDAQTIQFAQQVNRGKQPSLDNDPETQRTLSNLPRKPWVRGYINLQELTFAADSRFGQTVAPLKTMLNHVAFSIRKEYNGFHFNTLLAMQPDALALSKNSVDRSRFAYSLADAISSKNLAFYLGGSDLSAEWQNTLATLGQLNPSYGIILEGILRARVNKAFGDAISLSDDLYPLFEGEYALAAERLENDKLGLKLILRHTDRAFAEIKLKKLMEGFRMLAAQFSPKLKSVTLPDGTVSKELVADDSGLVESSTPYQDTSIECAEITDSPYGFCYALTDDLVLLSNHAGPIKTTLDLAKSPKFTLSQSQPFSQSLSSLSAVTDEISFIDLTNLMPLIQATPAGALVAKPLEPFQTTTWVKRYFDDGVATEGYLLLK